MPESDATPSFPFMAKAKLGMGGLVMGLLIGGAGAGWLWWQGDQALSTLQSDMDSRVGELQQAVDLANGRAHVMRARVQLDRAGDQASQENFGAAKASLSEAVGALDKATPKTAGVSAEAISSAKAALGSVSLEAGGDPTALGAQIGQAEAALDSLIGN